ncbi:MAG: hypothetical protein PVH61_36040 [Candidatus Aminicenantes bacterium]|jgi:hypothetical protein
MHTDQTKIFFVIALAVILFNLVAVWGLDILLHDDPMWYGVVLAGKFPKVLIKSSPLLAYKEWVAWHIMAYSPQLARGLYVLFLMVPLSCGFYYLLHHQLGFSRWDAVAAAILPNILPYQWQIPAGINMSYPLMGLLFALFALIAGLHYLEKTAPANWLWLVGAAVGYYLACHLMEQSLFLYPPLILAFIGYTQRSRKHFWLVSSFSIIAADKLMRMIVLQRKAAVSLPLEEIVNRIGLYFKWTLPFPEIHPLLPVIISSAIIIPGFILHLKHTSNTGRPIKSFDHTFSNVWSPARPPTVGRKRHVLFLYAFFTCWSISSLVVFLAMVPYFIPRYTYIAAYGQVTLLILSLSAILGTEFFKKYKLHLIVPIGLVVFSGIYRYINLKEIYSTGNTSHAIIVKELNKIALPVNSQVVVAGAKGIPGCWLRTSGYLKFALKRNDIDGLVGQIDTIGYYNFDRHFDPRDRLLGRRYLMTGLSLDRPVFLFLLPEKSRRLVQFEYALEWKGKTKNSPWTIIHVDKKTGISSPLVSGTGMEEYLARIKELAERGISQEEIMWGGPPSKEEAARLEQSL